MQAFWKQLDGFTQVDDIHLRAVTNRDEAFLQALFRQCRPHLAEIPMPVAFVDALIQQQYELQKSSYHQQFPGSSCFLITRHREPVGKMILHPDTEAARLRLVEICFVPQWRGCGYGRALLRALQLLVREYHWQLHLSVDNQNWRAKKWYQLLGFRQIGTSCTHDFMVWEANRQEEE